MQTRHTATAATVLTILAACAGCGGDGSATSSPANGASGKAPAATSSSQPSASQKPAEPQKATLAGIDFCTVLSAESLSPFGYQPSDGKPNVQGHDADCTYEGKKDVRLLLIADIDTVRVDTSAGRNFDVSGYPNAASDDSDWSCQLLVGVGDDRLSVILENTSDDNPAVHGRACDAAADLAKQAVAHAKKV